ncbi:MAG: cytochrome C [Puniceicoccaceae bacterium]|nr:cytochrome C [Puniceicoccaceae bacterium]|tara:strand:- start:12714 stop:13367 length:654 start_codon:yes stop_codon:yes gene_type:complete
MANVFPKWVNTIPIKVIVAIILTVTAVVCGVTYYATPKYTRVGYAPIQPVAFSHALHAGQLDIDCRYCHTFVDRSEHSNVPAANVCMTCHSMVRKDDPMLAPVKTSYESGEPIPWVRVHKTPDYVYFNHSVHVNRGVSCVGCHGRVDEMDVVTHKESFSMSFCLDCHRNPEEHVRPPEEVYNLDWERPDTEDFKKEAVGFVHDWKVNPPQSCSGCHR